MNLLTAIQGPLAGRYRLERELGRGGMAVVYLADDLKHERRVAVKVLRPELAAYLGEERFLREISLAAGLQHPHILPLHDSGVHHAGTQRVLFYVMPYVEGESLRDRMARESQLPIDDALGIACEVLGALGAAHAHGIVHRDIKPENILLSGGHALVADFGIARAVGEAAGDRLTDSGLAIGTPAYMSPEQALAERDVDARSDIYSLGCVLYEMLAGEPPFTGPTAQAILAKRLGDPVPAVRRLRETVSAEVDAALCRALARVPVDRFPTAAAFAAALRAGPQLATMAIPLAARRRTRWLPLAALAIVVAAVLWNRRSPASPGAGTRLALTDLVVTDRDASTDYLRSGIPDYLVTALHRLPGLEIVPMSLVRRASVTASPETLGRDVGATAVLSGSLARFGGTLRVTAELIEVASERVLWSGQFEYPDTNYAGLVPAVVGLIADSLQLRLSGADRRDAIARSTVDPVVLDLLLRAEHILSRGIAGAPGDSAIVDSARVLCERVLERSPRNPRAIAGMGSAYNIFFLRGWTAPGLPPDVLHARADSLSRLALSLDSTVIVAYGPVLTSRIFLEDDFEGAHDLLRRAQVFDSGDAGLYRMRGILRQEIDGDLTGALADFQRAVDIEPTLQRLNSLAAGLMAARRYSEAAAVLERSMTIRPNSGASTRLVTTYERLGRHADATKIRRLVDPSGALAAPFEAALAAGDTAAYTRAYRTALRRTADSLIARLDQADVVPAERFNVAELRIGALLCELGDAKKAMDLVENLYRIRPNRLRWIVTNVDLGCLREDPRYLPMVKAAGLDVYLRN